MTVRAWFTISALVLAALAAAFVFGLFASNPTPELVAHPGGARLQGALVEACWPRRGGEIGCERGEARPGTSTVPPTGRFRFVVAYPAQPTSGRIRIDGMSAANKDSSREIDDWRRSVTYELETGPYRLLVTADYGDGASISYAFAVNVTNSGS